MLAVQVCNPGIAMILTLVVSHTVVVCLSVCIPVLAAMTDIYIYIYIYIWSLFCCYDCVGHCLCCDEGLL